MPDQISGASRGRKILRAVLAVAFLTVFIPALFWLKRSGLLKGALEWIRELGPWAPFVFLFIYVGAVVLSVPASIFTLGAGFVFGMLWGSVYVIIAATIA